MQWFFSSGDSPFFLTEQLNTFSYFPEIFNGAVGFGSNFAYRLWFDYPLLAISKLLSSFGMSWFVLDKIYWIVAWCIGLFSIRALIKRHFPGLPVYISLCVYLCNTYTFMLFAGGQFGVFLAYCLLPYIVSLFLDLKKQISVNKILQLAITIAILTSFDLRIAVLSFFLAVVMSIFSIQSLKKICVQLSAIFTSYVLSVFFHLYWIIPSIIYPSVQALGKEFTSVGITSFLSFADFSHTISLLHPNWPENLFGKIYFMQPEFIIIPSVVFVSLLFIRKIKFKNNIFFLYPLVFLGVFFAKGTNEPFGFIYTWLFKYIPGFLMFRDPTKFFIYIALGYAILIPITIREVANRMHRRRWLPYMLFILFWTVSIRQVLFGDIKGNFHPHDIPENYVKFAAELSNDKKFSRVLWIPTADRYAYSDPYHPLLTIENFLQGSSVGAQLRFIQDKQFSALLQNAGVGYVGVPIDVDRKLFLDNYIFSPAIKQQYIDSLQHSSLTRIGVYKNIAIWKTENHKSLFTFKYMNGELDIPFQYTPGKSSTFDIDLHHTQKGSLVVRYAFDPYWALMDRGNIVLPKKTPDGFMEFTVDADYPRTITLKYLPQKWTNIGFILSFGYAVIVFSFIIIKKLFRR